MHAYYTDVGLIGSGAVGPVSWQLAGGVLIVVASATSGRVYLLPSQPDRTCTPYLDLGQGTDLHRGGAVRSCGTQRP